MAGLNLNIEPTIYEYLKYINTHISYNDNTELLTNEKKVLL